MQIAYSKNEIKMLSEKAAFFINTQLKYPISLYPIFVL